MRDANIHEAVLVLATFAFGVATVRACVIAPEVRIVETSAAPVPCKPVTVEKIVGKVRPTCPEYVDECLEACGTTVSALREAACERIEDFGDDDFPQVPRAEWEELP